MTDKKQVTTKEYELAVADTWEYTEADTLMGAMFGLTAEIGLLAANVLKKLTIGATPTENKDTVIILGNIYFYATIITMKYGYSINYVINYNGMKLHNRDCKVSGEGAREEFKDLFEDVAKNKPPVW